MIFSVKDSLRQAVEAASGGLNTVIYTKKGQPIFARVIPKFRVEHLDPSLGSGVHPAFIVGGREVPEIWIGMYPAHLSQGELISVPGVAPSALTAQNAIDAARASGPGIHVITNAEWAAMALTSIYGVGNGNDVVSGPDPYGRDRTTPKLFGRRVDGKAPGDTSAISQTLTGSGPLSWRHDLSPFGVADVSPGISPGYFVTGLMLVNGEIRIIPDNDAALPTTGLSPTSPAWRAILPDGSLVPAGSGGSLKYDIPLNASYTNDNVAQNLGAPVLRTQVQPAPWTDENQDYAHGQWPISKDPTSLSVPPLMGSLLLFASLPGLITVRPYGTRVARRGWLGLASLYMSHLSVDGAPTYVAYIPT